VTPDDDPDDPLAAGSMSEGTDRCSIGFGAVNPRTEPDEDPAAVAVRVQKLADLLGPERIWLNPDCGFGTFADRPVATAAVAVAKLRILADAARLLR
jgi:5-methyltetrahydropteroyltriglutamate--homocysteine methyltransferase